MHVVKRSLQSLFCNCLLRLDSCIWFVGQQGVCDVTIGMMGANVVSLLYDGKC